MSIYRRAREKYQRQQKYQRKTKISKKNKNDEIKAGM